MTTRIRYATFARQILLMVVPSCLLPVIFIALLVLEVSPWLVAAAVVAWVALIVWLIVRHMNGDGDVTLDEDGLTIVPRRAAFSAGFDKVRIDWSRIETVQAGATEASPPRVYTVLKTRPPGRRSWILLEHQETVSGFSLELLSRANVARARQGEEPLELRDPYNSTGWRIFAVCALVVFVGGIVAAVATGKAGELSVWARIAGVGGFAIPLTHLAFRSRRRKP